MTHHDDPDEARKATETQDDEADTEGHSMAALLAMRELGKVGARPRDPKVGRDEDLPALTKKFPSMRNENRKG